MTVYIEDSLIENSFLTYLLLLILNKIFNIKKNTKKQLLVSLLSGIIATFYAVLPLNYISNILFKLSVGVVIIYMYSKTNMLAKYITFIFLTALFAGINILVYYMAYGTINISNNFATHILILLLYLIYYLIVSCLIILKKNLCISNFVYQIKIIDKDLIVTDTAFLDSGNTLIDALSGTPIFVINFYLFNKIYKNITLEKILNKNFENLKEPHYIKSSFASGSSKMLVFSVDKIIIELQGSIKEITNAKLGLVYSKFYKNFNCNMLLNINTFI